MRISRFYIDQDLRTGTSIDLPEASAHYIVKVLRLRADDPLTLFNGNGYDYIGRVEQATKRGVRVSLVDQSGEEPTPPLSIHLGLGISKGERMDIAVQKATELGVGAITPLFTERSVVRLEGERLANRLDHWRKIMIGACEQSGRRRLPKFNTALPLQDWLTQGSGDKSILLDHRAEQSLPDLPAPDRTLRLLIGPEGGLSESERTAATEIGFIGIRLGPRVMRTETAPLAAIAAIQTLWGDFR